MKKIPTLFVRDETDRKYVTEQVDPVCQWVLDGAGVATRKYDGTCVAFSGAGWWARREVKAGKTPPPGWVLVESDPATGKAVGWEPIANSPFAKFHAEALDGTPDDFWITGTYELIGPKVQGNPEQVARHQLVRHAEADLFVLADRSFTALREWLLAHDYEGIVFHHPDGRMAKIKRRDFREVI